MATKLTHIRLLTSDVHRLADFYQEGFGFEKTLDIAEGFYVEVSAGEVVIGIYRRDLMDSITGQPAPGPGDRTVLCIAVDDVDAAHHRLVLNGAEEVTGPHGPGGLVPPSSACQGSGRKPPGGEQEHFRRQLNKAPMPRILVFAAGS